MALKIDLFYDNSLSFGRAKSFLSAMAIENEKECYTKEANMLDAGCRVVRNHLKDNFVAKTSGKTI